MPKLSIRERVACSEHEWLVAALRDRVRRLEATTAELEAMRRRRSVRLADALRRPMTRLRRGSLRRQATAPRARPDR